VHFPLDYALEFDDSNFYKFGHDNLSIWFGRHVIISIFSSCNNIDENLAGKITNTSLSIIAATMENIMSTVRLFFQSTESLQWRPVGPTTFQRDFDAIEGFHYVNGTHDVPRGRRRQDITVSAVAVMKSGEQISAEQVRAAWIALRQKHPAMASILQGTKRVYHKADKHELECWLRETLIAVPHDTVLTPELLDSLEASPRPTLYFIPKSSTYAIRVPHHATDTIGALYLMNDFLKALGEARLEEPLPRLNEKASDLACCLRNATETPSPSVKQLLRLLKMRQKWYKSYPSVGILPDQTKPTTGLSSWKDLQFSESQMNDLLKGSKKQGLTLTHAFHAALVVAAKEHGTFQEPSNYSSVIVINVRNRCADPSMLEKHVASTQHAIWPVTVPVSDFQSTAQLLKQRYTSAAKSADLLPLAETVFLEGMRTVNNSERFHSAPFISSFGKVESFLSSSHGSLNVEDVSFVVESSREDILVGVWSYKGKLIIRVMFNKGFHSDESIERYLHLTEKAFVNGLDILW
jgi:hypothetical protein